MRNRFTKGIGFAILLAAVIFTASPAARDVQGLPSRVTLYGEELSGFMVGTPFTLAPSVLDGTLAAASSGDEQLQPAQGEWTVSLLGIPIKTVTVQVDAERIPIPGGQGIGAAIQTQGVLIVGLTESDTRTPAQLAGLKSGDLLLSLNGQTLTGAVHLTDFLAKNATTPVEVKYLRNGQIQTAQMIPTLDSQDGRYRLGAWVRDSTAGVGTLSFYDPVTDKYGALGHAITDLDTGLILPVREGTLLSSNVVGIKRGQKGTPGELQGSFLKNPTVWGDIRLNNQFGIYGVTEKSIANTLFPDGLPIGSRSLVHTGPATILTTLDDQGVAAYQVEITRVARQNDPQQKSMTLRVTDPVLLQKTGGIVQGMSGSPILQDGRIIGAVTHVFVNDPTQGYGIFIEWMLGEADRI